MAGTFVAQNKIRPGAYITFKSVASSNLTPGTRGIVALPMYLPWGDTANLITVTADDFINGNIAKLVGLDVADAAAIPLREAFKNASTVLVGRLDQQAFNATSEITLGSVVVTAKAAHAGTFGNSISLSCVRNTLLNVLELVTTVKGVEVDRQIVTKLSSYIANGWVTFEHAGTDDPDFIEFAGTTLGVATPGTNSTPRTDDYTKFLNMCSDAIWNTMAFTATDETLKLNVKAYIENLREVHGKKVQAVVFNYPTANYEGIISVDQGYKIGEEVISAENFVAYVAGATAGATLTESNTYKVIEGATEIIGAKTVSEIEAGLQTGKLMLSKRQDRAIVIEKDINTLHTFTPEKGYVFSKNRIIRCLDDIATGITSLYENSYLGKVNNDESGRTLLKGDIIGYLNLLQAQGAIQNFNSTTDVQVLAGNDIESVVCEIAIQPIDSMEKLYLTVVVT